MAGGNVDLMLSGDLAAGLTVRRTGNNLFQVYSTDDKYNKIGKQYGFEEFGLNEEEANEFFTDLYEFAYQTLLNDIWQ